MSPDPAGWRPDPTGEHQYRYWDGEQWTDRVTDDAVASTTRDPVPIDRGAANAWMPEPGPSPSHGGAGSGPAGDGVPSPRPSPVGAGHHSGRIVRNGPSARLLAAAGAGAAAVIAAVVLFVVNSGGGTTNDDSEQDDQDGATAEEANQANELRNDMQAAARALETAGTFTFEAELEVPPLVEVEEAGSADPARIPVQGEVRLPDTMHQRIDGASSFFGAGAQERLASGGNTWRRASAFPETIDEIPWIQHEPGSDRVSARGGGTPDLLEDVPDAFAAHLIPQWLVAAAEHEDGGTDEGHRVVTASVADGDIPGGDRSRAATEPAVSNARVELTVDHSGLPLSVVFSAMVDATELSATYDLAGIGDPVTIETPRPEELDPLPTVDEQDIAAAAEEHVIPIGLTAPPDDWQLVAADVIAFPQDEALGCPPFVTVGYAGPATGWLQMRGTQRTSECNVDPGDGPSFTAGEHVGTVLEPSEDERGLPVDVGFGLVNIEDLTIAQLDIDDMAVTVVAFGVPELADVLASLGPVDPSEQAEPRSVDQPPGQSGRKPG